MGANFSYINKNIGNENLDWFTGKRRVNITNAEKEYQKQLTINEVELLKAETELYISKQEANKALYYFVFLIITIIVFAFII